MSDEDDRSFENVLGDGGEQGCESTRRSDTTPSDVFRTSGFERDMLRVLGRLQYQCSEPVTGVKLYQSLSDRGYTDLNRKRLYPCLDRLVDHGYVEKQPGPDGRTKSYVLADSGIELLVEYRDRVTDDLCILEQLEEGVDGDESEVDEDG